MAFPIVGVTNRFRAQAEGCSAALRKALDVQPFCSAYHSDSHTPSLSFSYDSIFTCFQLSHHLSTPASGAVCCSLSYLRFMSLLPGKNPLVSQSTEHGMLPFYDRNGPLCLCNLAQSQVQDRGTGQEFHY